MTLLAKITGGFFLALGLLLVGGGLFVTVGGSLGEMGASHIPMSLRMSRWLVPAMMGFALIVEGMLVAALGEVLWLLANIAENNARLADTFGRRS